MKILGRLKRVHDTLSSTRIIIDRHRRLNHPAQRAPGVDTSINKEEASRAAIFAPETPAGRFLEIGSGDGELRYLLGVTGNLDFDPAFYAQNKKRFDAKFEYLGLDLKERGDTVIAGDVCSPDFLAGHEKLIGKCAVVYSNNVFEHLTKPWVAAANIARLLQDGGVCITVVPFAQRYHESPGDYFRYTHKGVEALFDDLLEMKVLGSGYDILGRRNDWQGSGNENDAVPVDSFGAWRETWFTFVAFQKLSDRL